MTFILNIYQPCDVSDYNQEDPFDIFVCTLRQEEEPQLNALVYVEGKKCRIVAVKADAKRREVSIDAEERYYKVCVV